ncbi:MAG: PQQ-binding-like beta-propeller repeat protein, partial [Pseudomonadota bacterium]
LIPEPRVNASWTHRNGSPQHRIDHPALSLNPDRLWSVSIGSGNGRRQRITADPVIADGRIFAMDADANVSAVSTAGEVLWRHDLAPGLERTQDLPGGGLAVAADTLFVTDGFGYLTALEVGTGAPRWRLDLDAVAGPPTVSGGIVYAADRAGTGWAIDTRNGRVLWTVSSVETTANLIGGPSPAVSDQLALFPFNSGELLATFRQGGLRRWASTLSNVGSGRAYGRIGDIASDPVIDGSKVYASTLAGQLAALDLETGDRIWMAERGSYGAVWPAGDSLFMVTDDASVTRINASDGSEVWSTELPFFTRKRPRRRKGIFAHYGPVLAGGVLWVASSDGALRGFDPATGVQTRSVDVPGGAASTPVVAGQTLYLLNGRGQLHAYR